MKRFNIVVSLVILMGMVLSACATATPTPETIIETVEVEVPVVETVEVEVPVVETVDRGRLGKDRV